MSNTSLSVAGDNLGEMAGRDINKTNVYTGDTAYDVRGLSNPYLGLKAYTYAERARYAGRERDVDRALHLLTRAGDERPLLFITGASGSGKSSFAQAGLLPALEAFYRDQGFGVKRAVMRPGEQPLAELARAMHTLALPLDGVFAPAADYQLRVPVESADPNQVSLLILDQFEELFSQSDGSQRTAFFEMLGNLPPFKTSRLHLIATMRADYLPELFDNKALYEEAKNAGIDLRAMSEDELKVAIQKPMQAVHSDTGKRFQTALINRLAKDATNDAAYLPLLQVTLEDVWQSGFLTVDDYESLTDAIRRRAEEIYNFKLQPDGSKSPRSVAEQQLMLAIFLDLVEVSFNEDANRDVRRTRRLADVVKGDPASEALIYELAASRLLVTDEKELDSSGQKVESVDIIHESLIQNWTRLSDVILAERDLLQKRRRFELRLDEWKEKGKSSAYLLDGVYLAEAEQLNELNDVSMQSLFAGELVASSQHERNRVQQEELEKQRKSAQRLRYALIAVSFAGVLGLTLAAVLFVSWQRARPGSLIEDAMKLKNELKPDEAIDKLSDAERIAKTWNITLTTNITSEKKEALRYVATAWTLEGERILRNARQSSDEQLWDQAYIDATALFSKALALNPPANAHVYVFIESSTFSIGSTDEEVELAHELCIGCSIDFSHSEQPQSDVTIEGFWIMRTEVTNHLFNLCVEHNHCERPQNSRYEQIQFGFQPVTNVSWLQAAAYAKWVGGRLPSEAEWEYACKGSNQWMYPWGNDLPTSHDLNFDESLLKTWTDVGSYPLSPIKLYDMAGNVREWTNSRYSRYSDYAFHMPQASEEYPEDSFLVVRGGSFQDNAAQVRCSNRQAEHFTSLGKSSVGFRVVITDQFVEH